MVISTSCPANELCFFDVAAIAFEWLDQAAMEGILLPDSLDSHGLLQSGDIIGGYELKKLSSEVIAG